MTRHSKKKQASDLTNEDWRTSSAVFFKAAQVHYETLRQDFLALAGTDPLAAMQQYGAELIQAQVVHDNLQVVQSLLDEAETSLQACQAVQQWIVQITVQAVAEFSRPFASDLVGITKETSVSYHLQLLQVNTSPLNRLLKQLSGRS